MPKTHLITDSFTLAQSVKRFKTLNWLAMNPIAGSQYRAEPQRQPDTEAHAESMLQNNKR